MTSDITLRYGTLLDDIGHASGLKHPLEGWAPTAFDLPAGAYSVVTAAQGGMRNSPWSWDTGAVTPSGLAAAEAPPDSPPGNLVVDAGANVTDYTALLTGSHWSGIEVAGKSTIFTYSFPTTAPAYIAGITDPGLTAAALASRQAFSAGEAASARTATTASTDWPATTRCRAARATTSWTAVPAPTSSQAERATMSTTSMSRPTR